METVQSSDGTPIAFQRSGSGPPLVLAHAATVDHRSWARVAPLLARHFTVYALDRRGRGASGDAPLHAVEREVDDICAVLDAAGEPAYLLGHSSGAILALEAALRRPGLRGLAIYEPPLIAAGQRLRPAAGLAERLQRLVAAGEHEVALRAFLHEGPGLTEAEIDRMAAGPNWAASVALAHTTPYDARIVDGYMPDWRRLRVFQPPALLLVGEASPGWMRAGAGALAAAMPCSRIAVLRGQKHFAIFTAPELFAQAVVSFLAPDDD